MRPISSNSGDNCSCAGTPAKCNQTPPAARLCCSDRGCWGGVGWGGGRFVVNSRCLCIFIRWILRARRKFTVLAKELQNADRFLKTLKTAYRGENLQAMVTAHSEWEDLWPHKPMGQHVAPDLRKESWALHHFIVFRAGRRV